MPPRLTPLASIFKQIFDYEKFRFKNTKQVTLEFITYGNKHLRKANRIAAVETKITDHGQRGPRVWVVSAQRLSDICPLRVTSERRQVSRI